MYYFVINEHGGSGKAHKTWLRVKYLLDTAYSGVAYKARLAQAPGHATVITQEILSEDDPDIKIIVVGGDGTVNEVVNGLGGAGSFERVAFGVIPTGSGNDFSRGANIPRHNVKKALQKILSSKGERAIDVGHVLIFNKAKLLANKYFVISAGIGLDALVCKKVDTGTVKGLFNHLHIGKLSYALTTIKSFATLKPLELTVSANGARKSFGKVIFLAVMNYPCEGGGVPMAPKASAVDGKLSVAVCHGVSKWGCVLRFPILLLGAHEKLSCFDFFDCEGVDLHCNSEGGGVFHTDGEVVPFVTDAKFNVLPSKLWLLV